MRQIISTFTFLVFAAFITPSPFVFSQELDTSQDEVNAVNSQSAEAIDNSEPSSQNANQEVSDTLSDAKEASSPPQNIDELVDKLNELIEYHGIPGMSVAVVENRQITLTTGLGLANVESETPATEETRFRIGSISKMFVGLAALKLVEEGRLDLQTPIKELVPEIEFENPYANTDPVRVVHLLEHTSGWDDIHLPEYANNDPTPISLKDGLDYHPDSRVSRWRPGERMSYANSGPPVVAYIIQKITGTDFEQYVSDHFFKPLNMQSATYREPDNSITTLYVNNEPVDYWHILMRPSGSVNASALDMANFILFLANSGTFNNTELLNPASLRTMETPSTTLAAKAGSTHGYGLTNYTSFYKGFKFHGHDGGVQGGAARLVYDPDNGNGFYFAVNTNSPGMSDIFDAIAKYVTKDAQSPALPTAFTVSKETSERYSGLYMSVNPRQEMMRFTDQITGVRKLSLNPQGATLTNTGDVNEYIALTENSFRLEERPLASLILLEDESGLAIQVGNQYLHKISAFRHYSQQFFMWSFVALLVFHFFWFFWWLGRKLLGKSKSSAATQVKLWPFLASLSIYVAFIAMIIGQVVDVFALLGKPSVVSVSMMVGTYLFALFTLGAVVQLFRYYKKELHWFTRYVCLFTCVVYSVTALYFAYFGVIGLNTFA